MDDYELSANGDTYLVDPLTGEIFTATHSKDPWYSKPIDISAIGSRLQYEEAIKECVGRRKYKLWVSPFLLDIVIDKQLSPSALGLFCYLGQNIGYNNMVYLTTKQIVEDTGYSRQTVSTSLSEIENNHLIRKVDNKLEGRDDRFYLVNPLYFYLGYYPNRDRIIKEWLVGSG